MSKKICIQASALAVAALVLLALAGPLAAQVEGEGKGQKETGVRSGLVILKKDDNLSVWTRRGRDVFTLNSETVMPQRPLLEGTLIVVRETAPGSKVAKQVIIVDEEIWVAGKSPRERAIIGRFDPSVTSPDHMLIRTRDGKQAFVIDPKTFRQPFPQPNQRVALTYRVEAINPPLYKATGLVVLPDVFDDSPVKITYQDIPRPAPEPAPAPPAPAPAPAPEPMVTLPQTASQSPLLVLAGLVLLAGGLVVRFWR